MGIRDSTCHIYHIFTYIYAFGAGPTCPTGKEGAKRPPQFDKPKGVKQPILPAKQIRGWAPSAPHTHWCASNNPPSCNPLPCLRQVSQRTVQAHAQSPCHAHLKTNANDTCTERPSSHLRQNANHTCSEKPAYFLRQNANLLCIVPYRY